MPQGRHAQNCHHRNPHRCNLGFFCYISKMQRIGLIFSILASLIIGKPAFCGAEDFAATVANKNKASGKAPEGMVWIPGGEFSMGAMVGGEGSHAMPMASNDSQPVHRVYVDA